MELLRVGLKGRQEAQSLGCDWLWRSAEQTYREIAALRPKLDKIDKLKAVADEKAFRNSHLRTKWDVFLK